jgi:DNA-binding NtrC family response regulator
MRAASGPNSHADAAPEAAPAVQRILVVEDMEDTRTSLQQMLELSLGLPVEVAEDGAQGLAMLNERPYSVVITDLRMPKLSGMQMIEKVLEQRLPVTIIVTTGHGGIGEAVQAMRLGAYDFLTKPPDPQYLSLLVERALRERALLDEVTNLRQQVHGRHTFQNVISKSPKMHAVFELISYIAPTASTVLVIGETGTGKEQIARAIHQASSASRTGPFVVVNCAALPETLLESELFGHEKGSFTGATTQRKGRFELANGGTLFLDEIGDVPMSMQVKLLRVLQERTIERVGGMEPIKIDVRIVAATNRPLEGLVKEEKFREDLYYRLNVIRIELPPLRERLEDVPVLASHFAQKWARPGQPAPAISPEAMQVLLSHRWSGNVRELENVIERACVTVREGVIMPVDLPGELLAPTEPLRGGVPVDLSRPLPDQLAEITAMVEKRYLLKALKKTRGHIGRCAKISGLSRRSISDKISQYQIDVSQFKGDRE